MTSAEMWTFTTTTANVDLTGFKVEARDGSIGKIDELDGVTVDAWDSSKIRNQKSEIRNSSGWWFNVRASNTEPLLRLNAEAKDQATLDKLLAEIEPMLGTPDHGGR